MTVYHELVELFLASFNKNSLVLGLQMEINEEDFIEKISEFHHDNMRAWISAVLDLYGNVISKINTPVTQIHMDDWRILVNKRYADLSEGEKEYYRAKARWLWYKQFKSD
jgi:hypothetical protein